MKTTDEFLEALDVILRSKEKFSWEDTLSTLVTEVKESRELIKSIALALLSAAEEPAELILSHQERVPIDYRVAKWLKGMGREMLDHLNKHNTQDSSEGLC